MLLRVCRAFSKSPDEVRGWDFEDYSEALKGTFETPPIYESFWNSFCKPKPEPKPFKTPAERAKVFQELEAELNNER